VHCLIYKTGEPPPLIFVFVFYSFARCPSSVSLTSSFDSAATCASRRVAIYWRAWPLRPYKASYRGTNAGAGAGERTRLRRLGRTAKHTPKGIADILTATDGCAIVTGTSPTSCAFMQ
jgi:hypothetical protein